ncbi:hypothetical protein HED60_18570 [Planctomycetales bacterium ZRK34]|nr:hypothetical protein HED60_18570 [Planctomycetales bacterium ZRK34]
MTMRIAILMLGLIVAAGQSAQADLIGYWSFDGSSGADESSTGNNATVGSSITYETDVPFGTGLSAQNYAANSSNVVTVPTSATLQSISQQLTVSFWMKATAGANWVRIFQHGNETDGSQTWLIDRFDNTFRTNLRVDTVDDPGPPFVDGNFNQNIADNGADTIDSTWHHLTYVLDNGAWRKYVDGSETSGTYLQGAGLSNTRDLYIFGRNGTGQYIGQLDDIGLRNDALSAGKSIAIYNLATESALAYDLGLVEQLFDVFDEVLPEVTIGDYRWIKKGGLSGAAGELTQQPDGEYALVLDDAGFGVVSIPEPASLTLLAIAGAAVMGRTRRR